MPGPGAPRGSPGRPRRLPSPSRRGRPGPPGTSSVGGRGRPLRPPPGRARLGPGAERGEAGGEKPPRFGKLPGSGAARLSLGGRSHAREEAPGQTAQHRLGRGARPRGAVPGEEGPAHRALPQRLRAAG